MSISIHALLAESDTHGAKRVRKTAKFLSTLSCGERPAGAIERINALQFLSTLSLRRATEQNMFAVRAEIISIHALLAESDAQ